MIQQSFTAKELFCMAYLCGKKNLFGLPDVISAVPENARKKVIQSTIDELIDRQIVTLGIDGETNLVHDYDELISIFCDCDKCLTVNLFQKENILEETIFWKWSDHFFKAEIEGDRYTLYQIETNDLLKLLSRLDWLDSGSTQVEPVSIPLIYLTKAKRYAFEHDTDEAIRILHQNGANESLAEIIVDALQGYSNFLNLLLMDNTSGECKQTERGWVNSRGITVTMGKEVVNFRSAASFSVVPPNVMQKEVQRLVDAFIKD